MSDSEPRSLMLGGYALRSLDSGAGEPLLLVHGSLCDCRFWRPQMQSLGQSRRVLAVSLRRYWPEAWDGSGGGFGFCLICAVGEDHVDAPACQRLDRVAADAAAAAGDDRDLML